MDCVFQRPKRAAGSMSPAARYNAVAPPARSECEEKADGLRPFFVTVDRRSAVRCEGGTHPPLRQEANRGSLFFINVAGKQAKRSVRVLTAQISAMGESLPTRVCERTQPWLSQSVLGPEMWIIISSTCGPQWVSFPPLKGSMSETRIGCRFSGVSGFFESRNSPILSTKTANQIVGPQYLLIDLRDV